jgi:serine/threonine protein kinase
MLTACPECGTQVVAGHDCPLCGTPTPAPTAERASRDRPTPDDPPQPPDAAVRPVPGASPPVDAGHSRPLDTAARYANQWEVIYEKIRAAVAPKYEVTGILGWGGMAGVYLANEPRLGRKVAIKVMSPGLMVDPQLVERFSQEARTIAQFNHPNIVTIFEVDERGGLHYFTMTYVAGRTLGQVMAGSDVALPISVVRAWLYQIGDALAYAHHHGVVHRDVKPGNVLLDQRGNALVTDFGIAKVTDEPGLTRTGMLVGTPAYMSPEQCSSGKVEGSSDQYSLGAVAYQMLTGQPPFSGPTLSVLQAHVGQEPRPIRELRPDCPDDMVAAVQRMLEKKAGDRWPTLSAAVAAAGASAPAFDGPVRKELELLAAQAATIRVEPWFDVVREGSSESLRATVMDARGRVLDDRNVEWRSGDDLIASVTNGRLRAVSPGNTTVDAVCGGAAARLTLTVESDPVPAIEVEPAVAVVAAGARIPLDAIVTDWDGARLDERAVLWSSSDSTIARVSGDGVVEGIRPGEAVVTASTGGKSAASTVTVGAGAAPAVKAIDSAGGATLRPAGRSEPKPGTPAPSTPAPVAPSARGMTPAGGVTHVPRLATSAPKRRNTVLALALSIIGVIAIVSVIVLSGGGDGDTAGTGTIEIVGNLPAGAQVAAIAADGIRTTLTDGEATLPAGSYTLEFTAAGYDTYRGSVQLESAGSVTWSPVLTETVVPVNAGRLALADGLPEGATVMVTSPDGSSQIITGITALAPGEYTISFAATGYEDVTSAVTITADQTTTFEPILTRAAAPPPTVGTLRIAGTLPAGARLRIRPDGGQFRVVSAGTMTLDPGRYTLEFSADGYETDTRALTIAAAGSQTWTPNVRATQPDPAPQPTTGTLRIDRGGLPAGSTITLRPQSGAAREISTATVELAPGSYTIEFAASGYRPFTGTVRIAAGATQSWTPTLTALDVPPPDTGPTRDPAADRAAIETAVRDFVAAFNRRDAATVVPLLPAPARDGWRALLTNASDVTNFSASLASIENSSLDGDEATVQFNVQVSYENRNVRANPVLPYVGTARRTGNTWRLVSLEPGG